MHSASIQSSARQKDLAFHRNSNGYKKIKAESRSKRFRDNPNLATTHSKRVCLEALQKCVDKFRSRQEGISTCRITRHYDFVEAPGLGSQDFKRFVNGQLSRDGERIIEARRNPGRPDSIRPPARTEAARPPRRKDQSAVLVCRSASPNRKAEAVSVQFDPRKYDERGRLREVADRVCKRSMVACMYKHENIGFGYRRCRVTDVVILFANHSQKTPETILVG